MSNTIDPILTIHQIPGKIVDIIEESEKYCFLVTPFYQPWKILNRSLERAAIQNKKIIFILRSGNIDSNIVKTLNTEMGFDIVVVNRLHTKLYINEKEALISSMNILESSKDNNYEIGYVVNGSYHVKKIKERIIDNDILGVNEHKIYQGRYLNEKKEEIKKGYCIRCKKEIDFKKGSPLCDECFAKWSYFNNWELQEKFCHKCGSESGTTKANPLCEVCSK